MAQQTAVEWLVNQEISVDLGSGIKMGIPIPQNVIDKAKQMEKEQIKDAYNQAYREVEEDCCKEVGPDIANFANAEDYYNETFGNK